MAATLDRLLGEAARAPRPPFESLAAAPSWLSERLAAEFDRVAAMIARTQESRAVRIYLVALAAGLSFAVGASRVYLGVHWPTDVIAGWAAGAGWAMLCLLAADRIARGRDG